MRRNRRHWFHCSDRDLGDRWTATRIVPMPEANESNTPRLCVCRDIAACFAARVFSIGRPVWVYRTRRPTGSVRPVGVWDAGITGERWLVPPVEMMLVGLIDQYTVSDIQWSSLMYVSKTWEPFNLSLRSACLIAAIDELGNTEPEREVAAYLRSRFKIEDPHAFIIAAMERRLKLAAERRTAS